ncbi:hypothetical protein HK096_003402, partial [Nowakowskiella sp. JEL0078]
MTRSKTGPNILLNSKKKSEFKIRKLSDGHIHVKSEFIPLKSRTSKDNMKDVNMKIEYLRHSTDLIKSTSFDQFSNKLLETSSVNNFSKMDSEPEHIKTNLLRNDLNVEIDSNRNVTVMIESKLIHKTSEDMANDKNGKEEIVSIDKLSISPSWKEAEEKLNEILREKNFHEVTRLICKEFVFP